MVPGGQPPGADLASAPNATGVVRQPKTVGFISSRVSADAETNSLVLFVSPSQYEELRPVIARLDLERQQVQISAVVAEVSLKRVRDVGVNWQALTSGGVVGSFRGGLTEEGLLSYLAGGHFVVGAVGPNSKTISVNGQDIQVPEFFAFLSALQDDSDFNLISAPRVLTQDNKEATMNVGQVVPFATGGRLDAFGSPLVTFDYREVGIKLEVTPHISQSGKIRMDVNQEIQEVTDFLKQEMSGVSFSAPIVSNRNVKTTVTVGNGETLLIGGLISKRTVEAVKGVPILKDLPLIGGLFRQQSTDEQKTTVFISITPQIVPAGKELPRLDQPFQPYVSEEGNPGDQQPENRETVVPEGSTPAPTTSSASPTRPAASLSLQGFHFPQDVGPGRVSRPTVVVRNQDQRPLDLVLEGVVKRPDGKSVQLDNLPLTLGIGEERQVQLPHYAFPNQGGVYRFDVVARFQGEVVARLPNPWQIELPQPPPATGTAP
jgi:type II secretory pathway component GspD/PulD (secretin)